MMTVGQPNSMAATQSMPYKDSAKQRECERQSKARHREQVRARGKAYHVKHRERLLAKAKSYYVKNRERLAAKRNGQQQLIQAKNANYYETNKDRLKAECAAYRRQNPHVDVNAKAKRRLRIEATVENEGAIAHFIKLIRSSTRVACYYCQRMIHGKDAHIDHIVPLSKGGGHTGGNICASCRVCNQRKHAKLLTEWQRDGQQILPL